MLALRNKDTLWPQDELSAGEVPGEDSRQDSGHSHSRQPPTQNGSGGVTQKHICETVGDAVNHGAPHPKPRPTAVDTQELANQSIRACMPIASCSPGTGPCRAPGEGQALSSARAAPAGRCLHAPSSKHRLHPVCQAWRVRKLGSGSCPDIHHEQGVLGVISLASECSRKPGRF